MSKIIACVDGSAHADGVCRMSAWAAQRTGLAISLLHAVAPHSDVGAKGDLSGQIGLGAKSALLKQLTEMDEARGKLEQKKGQLMLEHAKEELGKRGITQPDILHRRGSLVEIIAAMEAQAALIVMGKRGEQADAAPDHLGSNLERVARVVHKPLLVTPRECRSIDRFIIAYDGGAGSQRAVDYALHNPLLKGLECHLLRVGDAGREAEATLKQVEERLVSAGYAVHASLRQGQPVEEVVAGYVTQNAVDLLVTGAYDRSRIRSLMLGSTTTALIRRSDVPVLLFR